MSDTTAENEAREAGVTIINKSLFEKHIKGKEPLEIVSFFKRQNILDITEMFPAENAEQLFAIFQAESDEYNDLLIPRMPIIAARGKIYALCQRGKYGKLNHMTLAKMLNLSLDEMEFTTSLESISTRLSPNYPHHLKGTLEKKDFYIPFQRTSDIYPRPLVPKGVVSMRRIFEHIKGVEFV